MTTDEMVKYASGASDLVQLKIKNMVDSAFAGDKYMVYECRECNQKYGILE